MRPLIPVTAAHAGVLARWRATDGAQVERGQPLLDATGPGGPTAICAPEDGRLAFTLLRAGEASDAGAVLARVEARNPPAARHPTTRRTVWSGALELTMDELDALVRALPSVAGPRWTTLDAARADEDDEGPWLDLADVVAAGAPILLSLWVHGSDGASLQLVADPGGVYLWLDAAVDDALGPALTAHLAARLPTPADRRRRERQRRASRAARRGLISGWTLAQLAMPLLPPLPTALRGTDVGPHALRLARSAG